MNYYRLIYKLIIILFVLSLTDTYAYSIYTMELRNGNFIDHKTYEFEVYILANQENFTLNAYQCVFVFNKAIINNGVLNFEFVQGTSELANSPEYGIGVSGSFWLPMLTFASNAGQDLVQNSAKRIGRFRIRNSTSFVGKLPALKWKFGSDFSTIVCGNDFENLTNPSAHTYTNIGYPLAVTKGWNFISVPFQLKDMSIKSIFPNAVSNAFISTVYGYQAANIAEVGKAYWIEFAQESLVEIKGEIADFQIPLKKGWNNIGIFHYSVPTSNLKTHPPAVVTSLFGINNSQYYSTNLLEPGKGYQVYSEDNGFLILDPNN